MKNKALSLTLVLAALTGPILTRTARAEVEVSFDYFQDALSPLGEWIEVGDYGSCWRPNGVAEDWSPYSDGYWAYTDAGWTWVSYEDWGGITYHYGRWVNVRDEGWAWTPGYNWGPAWVSWRSSNDYVGWAPLPPEARWEQDTGFSTWVDTSYDIGPDNYRFCNSRDFGSPFLAPLLLPYERNVTIIENTVNITNISYNNSSAVIFNGGPNFVTINQHSRHPIPALQLVREDRAVRDVRGHAPPQVLRGNQLAVFAPKVTRPADIKALPVKPRRVVTADKINRGWGRVADPAAQQEIRKKLGAQSAGLTPASAPARPPRADELSSIPRKADPKAPAPDAIGRVKPPRKAEAIAGAPQVSPRLGEPVPTKRTAPIIDPRPQTNPSEPSVKLPQVSVPEHSRKERPANPANSVKPFQPQQQPIKNPRSEKPQRQPQAEAVSPAPAQPQPAAADENARNAEKALRRQQREQDQAAAQSRENAQRAAEGARRQQEAAPRSTEIRQQPPRQQAPQVDTARQQQEAAQRANELRNQRAQQQRQQARQADVSRQSQEAAQRANELRSQQAQQQRQQARQANAMRQQQESSQRANEMRNFQAQQQRQQAQQAEAGRRHQESAQRANEMRHQQMQQQRQQQRQQPQHVEVRRQQPPPPQAQQPAPSRGSSSKDGDDEKKKNRGR